MADVQPLDRWSDGEAYERYVGRWSRVVAEQFLVWLDAPTNLRWLDVGCGTGALSSTILNNHDPVAVLGVDKSHAYVAEAARRIDDLRAKFEQRDAGALPFDGEFDAAVSGLVLNFLPDARAAVAGMARAVRADGLLAAYVWDYADGMQFMRYFWDAAAALFASARDVDEAARFPLCRPDALAALWADVGLTLVETTGITIPTHFENFDDYWEPFLGGQGAAPTYLTSLTQEEQETLRDALRASVPTNPDGSIHMTARAWVVKGRRAR